MSNVGFCSSLLLQLVASIMIFNTISHSVTLIYMKGIFHIHVKNRETLVILTSAIFIAEIRKPPNIAQPNKTSSHRQQKVNLARPFLTLGWFSFCFILRPSPRALARWRFENILMEIFQTLQFLFCCHVFVFYKEGKYNKSFINSFTR